MLIGVPKEVKTHEYRVGLVPGSVRELMHHGHQVIVGLPDEIDIINSDATRAALDQALAQRPGVLVADMTATTFCACDGVSALIRAYRRAAANGAEVRIAARAPLVRRPLPAVRRDSLPGGRPWRRLLRSSSQAGGRMAPLSATTLLPRPATPDQDQYNP